MSSHFLVEGVAVPLAETAIACIYSRVGRTRFVEAARVLNIKPKVVLGKNLWTVEQAQRVQDHYVSRAADCDKNVGPPIGECLAEGQGKLDEDRPTAGGRSSW